MCESVCGYVLTSAVALRGQRHWIPRARVTAGCDCLTWVLGTDRGSAAGGMLALKHPVTSTAPSLERLH